MTNGETDGVRLMLNHLWERQGKPSMRIIARKTGGAVSYTGVSDALAGRGNPRWRTIEHVTRALGGDVNEMYKVWTGKAYVTPTVANTSEAPPDPPEHGLSMYTHGKCRCAVCKQANRDYHRAHRAELKLRGPKKHGVSGYKNYGCRCPTCITAHKKADRDYYQKKKRKQSHTG